MRIKQIGKLYTDYQKQLYISAIAITKNREQAEDAVHDALISVISVQSEIKDLKAYLFSAVRNKALYARTRLNKQDNCVDDFIDVEESSM